MKEGRIECPICGKLYHSLTYHFKTHGYKLWDDFLRDYPGTPAISESLRLRRKRKAEERWANPEWREKTMKTFESDEFKEKMSVVNKEIGSRSEVKTLKSKTMKDKWANDGEYQEKMRIKSEQEKLRWINDEEYRNKRMRIIKEVSQRPGVKKKQSESRKRYLKSPGVLETISKKSKEMWAEDTDERKKHRIDIISSQNTDEYCKQRSELSKQIWEKEGHQELISEKMKDKWANDEEYQEKMKDRSERVKWLFENDEEYQEKMRKRNIATSERWANDEDYRSKCLRITVEKPTSIERKIGDTIEKFDLPFKYIGDGSEFVGHMNPDFISTNESSLVIEAFGDYWHTKNGPLDEFNRRILLESEGWKCLVLWESEINKMTLKEIALKIISFLQASS